MAHIIINTKTRTITTSWVQDEVCEFNNTVYEKRYIEVTPYTIFDDESICRFARYASNDAKRAIKRGRTKHDSFKIIK